MTAKTRNLLPENAVAILVALMLVTATAFTTSHRDAYFAKSLTLPKRQGQRRPAIIASSSVTFVSGDTCTGEQVVVVGATGYIGKAVVRESIRRGYPTKAVVRDKRRAESEPKFSGAEVVETDVTNTKALASCPAFAPGAVDVVVSCLASRTGTKSDSYAIDYQATLNCLEAARAAGARHFVLLSAYCVKSAERRDPYALQFQYAKKEFEGKLESQDDCSYSIVRPTAFFKSVSGQLEVVDSGAPFVYFDLGGGRSATCNPISEADLAIALVDTIADPKRKNKVWNIGGPDNGLSMEEQGKMLAKVLGKEEPKLLAVPIGLFDVIISGIQGVANLLGQWEATQGFAGKFEDAAELGRIGKYYAVEDMLTTEPDEKFGFTSLMEHYTKIAVEGQEYDPYTTMFASAAGVKDKRGVKEAESAEV